MSLDSFTTRHLLAERLTSAHLPDLRRMDTDPQMMAHLGGPQDEATTLAYLEHNLIHWADHGFGVWVLHALPTRQVVGRACVRHLVLDQDDEVEIGYGLLPTHWGQGWGTEIASACVDLALNRIGCPSVVALTRPANVASQRVLGKVGLAYERDVEFERERHLLFRRRERPKARG